jgi:FkbM family methyltransferase
MITSSSPVEEDDILTCVLDIGGRYGVHPTWKSFKGNLKYIIFEPDREEVARLKQKYASRPGVLVVDQAVHDTVGPIKLHMLRHKGQSSVHAPNPESVWFGGIRAREGELIEERNVDATTVDAFCVEQQISPDFLKSDTEGNEFNVLRGATRQLASSILGVRLETYFDFVFKGIALFPKLHDAMLEAGFFLINLDYSGQGVFKNEFIRYNSRYGILHGCDAVYMKRYEHILAKNDSDRQVGARALKCAAFMFANHASDVAFDILIQARQAYPYALQACRDSTLFRHVSIEAQKLIKDIQYQPGQDIGKLAAQFKYLFDKDIKVMHNYFESSELNPD